MFEKFKQRRAEKAARLAREKQEREEKAKIERELRERERLEKLQREKEEMERQRQERIDYLKSLDEKALHVEIAVLLEDFLADYQARFNYVCGEIDELNSRMKSVESDVNDVSSDISSIRSDVSILEAKLRD